MIFCGVSKRELLREIEALRRQIRELRAGFDAANAHTCTLKSGIFHFRIENERLREGAAQVRTGIREGRISAFANAVPHWGDSA